MSIFQNEAKRKEIVQLLTQAYWMEIETVMNYLALSIDLDGVRAEEIKKALAADVTEELSHAQLFGKRIKTLYGSVPGSGGFRLAQSFLQPPKESTDVAAVIRGVIEAERGAIEHYSKIIQVCQEADPVTADMMTTILADEEEHMRTFEGYLKEYDKRA